MSNGRRQAWSRRVAAWQSSGMTCREFAASAGVNPSTLAWWKWKLASRDEGAELGLTFFELTGVGQPACRPASGRGVTVQMGEAQVAVPVDFDEATLVRVLAVLRSCQ